MDKIAIASQTDKSSVANDYTSVYEHYFAPLREEPLYILELGVAEKAGSLRLWSEYFPNAQIFGIDCDSRCLENQIERTQMFVGNLMDNSFMQRALNSIGRSLDIIIDDAGHTQPQILHSLQTLWPHLASGGIYVIEDLHTSYLSSFGMSYRQPGTAIEELKGLVDVLHVDAYKRTPKSGIYEVLEGQALPATELDQFERSLCSIHFYPGICFLFKADDNEIQ